MNSNGNFSHHFFFYWGRGGELGNVPLGMPHQGNVHPNGPGILFLGKTYSSIFTNL